MNGLRRYWFSTSASSYKRVLLTLPYDSTLTLLFLKVHAENLDEEGRVVVEKCLGEVLEVGGRVLEEHLQLGARDLLHHEAAVRRLEEGGARLAAYLTAILAGY